MKLYIKSSIDWADLTGSEQSAAERALQDIKYNGIRVEDAVEDACYYIGMGNAEPEYEDEDFYTDEPDYNKVLSYLKSKYGELE